MRDAFLSSVSLLFGELALEGTLVRIEKGLARRDTSKQDGP